MFDSATTPNQNLQVASPISMLWWSPALPSQFSTKSNSRNTSLNIVDCTFAQVEGSPFTVEPLSCLLKYDGLMSFGNCVTGSRPLPEIYNFDKLTTAILSNMKCKIPPDNESHTFNYDMLFDGIKKWPEITTTSPSGHHLRIYKALGKHVIPKKERITRMPPRTNSWNPQWTNYYTRLWHIVCYIWYHAIGHLPWIPSQSMENGMDNFNWERTW